MFFFFNDTATTEIYTLSLHDALPIYYTRQEDDASPKAAGPSYVPTGAIVVGTEIRGQATVVEDRKSTRLNSSHANISYAVFCLKKKKYTYYILLPHSCFYFSHPRRSS